MGKMKLYDLAKELNLTSKELITIAQGLGIDVKSHLSNLEEADIKKIKSSFYKYAAELYYKYDYKPFFDAGVLRNSLANEVYEGLI